MPRFNWASAFHECVADELWWPNSRGMRDVPRVSPQKKGECVRHSPHTTSGTLREFLACALPLNSRGCSEQTRAQQYQAGRLRHCRRRRLRHRSVLSNAASNIGTIEEEIDRGLSASSQYLPNGCVIAQVADDERFRASTKTAEVPGWLRAESITPSIRVVWCGWREARLWQVICK